MATVATDDPARAYRNVDQFSLADLETIRVVLRGGSVIDWHRLNFRNDEDLYEFIRAHEFDPRQLSLRNRFHDSASNRAATDQTESHYVLVSLNREALYWYIC